MPWLSSSAPGPSPTKTSSAFGLPDAEDDVLAPGAELAAPAVAELRRTSSRRGESPEPRAITGSDGESTDTGARPLAVEAAPASTRGGASRRWSGTHRLGGHVGGDLGVLDDDGRGAGPLDGDLDRHRRGHRAERPVHRDVELLPGHIPMPAQVAAYVRQDLGQRLRSGSAPSATLDVPPFPGPLPGKFTLASGSDRDLRSPPCPPVQRVQRSSRVGGPGPQ